MSRYIILLITLTVLSCNTQPKIHQDTNLSEKLTGEGSELTMQRISLKGIDSLKRIDLNRQAIQKFDSAYHLDTTNLRAALLASECCFFGKEFQQCIYWLKKLIFADTSKHNRADHYEMAGFCYVNLGNLDSGKTYFSKALNIWKDIAPSNQSIVTVNLSDISDKIYAGSDINQINNFNSKGIDPCQFSVKILDYLATIDTTQDFKSKGSERQKSCR
jgi:tetratricopeptide (TPR) repeat protein